MAKTSIKDVIDDDGNIIAPPAPDHPVMAIIYLLEYGRKRGFRIGPTVQVDGVIVQAQDLRQALQNAPERHVDLDPDSDMAKILANQG